MQNCWSVSQDCSSSPAFVFHSKETHKITSQLYLICSQAKTPSPHPSPNPKNDQCRDHTEAKRSSTATWILKDLQPRASYQATSPFPCKHEMPRADWMHRVAGLSPLLTSALCPVQLRGRLRRARYMYLFSNVFVPSIPDFAHIVEVNITWMVAIRAQKKTELFQWKLSWMSWKRLIP